jgi:anti-sigma factor RsiW
MDNPVRNGMRLVGQLSSDCKLAREHISLHLDGELSEFEQIALDAHLTSCAGCRGYGASVAEVTTRLRSAPFEQPAFPVVLPHRSRIRMPLRTAQVAAAAVVVTVVGFSAAGVTPGGERSLSLNAANARADQAPNLAARRGAPATVDVLVQVRAAPRPASGRVVGRVEIT